MASLWEFETPAGAWYIYGTNISQHLERLLASGSPDHVLQFTLGSQRHRCCVRKMIDSFAGYQRRIRRVYMPGPHWHWFDGVSWVRYNDHISTSIEAALITNGSTSVTGIQIGRWSYRIQVNNGFHEQINLATGSSRPVLRFDYANSSSMKEHLGEDVPTAVVNQSDMDDDDGDEEDAPDDSDDGEESEDDENDADGDDYDDSHEVAIGLEETVHVDDQEEDCVQELEELLAAADTGSIASDSKCALCLEHFTTASPAFRLGECFGHYFHSDCGLGTTIRDLVFRSKHCPVCKRIYGIRRGDQPDGEMTVSLVKNMPLAGFDCSDSIVLQFNFPCGIQQGHHPSPGARYSSEWRIGWLPDCPEGRRVLELMKTAWRRRLLFTLGYSQTRQIDGVIIYNGIHMKTSPDGGPANHGYPDPTYLQRVVQELADKGVM